MALAVPLLSRLLPWLELLCWFELSVAVVVVVVSVSVLVLVMVDVLVWVLSPAPDAEFPISASATPETPNPMAIAVASKVFFITHSIKVRGAVGSAASGAGALCLWENNITHPGPRRSHIQCHVCGVFAYGRAKRLKTREIQSHMPVPRHGTAGNRVAPCNFGRGISPASVAALIQRSRPPAAQAHAVIGRRCKPRARMRRPMPFATGNASGVSELIHRRTQAHIA